PGVRAGRADSKAGGPEAEQPVLRAANVRNDFAAAGPVINRKARPFPRAVRPMPASLRVLDRLNSLDRDRQRHSRVVEDRRVDHLPEGFLWQGGLSSVPRLLETSRRK